MNKMEHYPGNRNTCWNIHQAAVSGSENSVHNSKITMTALNVTQIIPTPPAEHLPELWMAPPKNINFIGRSELLEKIEQHYNEKGTPVILTACNGLGGVGKTQVALEFVWQNYKKYKGVVWFDSENLERLQNSYINLGRDLNIIRDDEKKDAAELARRVKLWLEHHSRAGWLLVYDNAPNYESIRELLPAKEGKLLVTSRYSVGWPDNSISIDVFTVEESRAYIKKVLGNLVSESDTIQVDKLGEVLGRLPLALAIACTYLKKNKAIDIQRYLELYEQRKMYILSIRKILESEELFRNSYTESQFTSVNITWEITMDKLRKESLLAANWLNACAYLASNDIPYFLMEEFTKTEKSNPEIQIYEEALGTLDNYSMISINEPNRSSSIHHLVQEVIRLKLQVEERESILVKVFDLLVRSAPEGVETLEYIAKVRNLLPHFEAIILHLNNQLETPSEALSILQAEIKKDQLLVKLAEWYILLGYTIKAREIYERVLPIMEKHYGSNHPEVAKVLSNLAVLLFI